jgi:lipooligosaccharide transport system ATP-binding protein
VPPLVDAQNLTKRYGAFTAVDSISFAVDPGECLAVLGPNGAGKSSTMRMIYCASPVSSGTLRVDGMDVMRRPREVKRIVGVCPQQDNLDPDLTVRENLLVYGRYFGMGAGKAGPKADELLDLFQLAERAGSPVDTLSGGMQRRLVIARALLNDPKLLILDEPTTGLDPQARQLVWLKLRQLRARGATMVLTTHYMEEAARLADRIVVVDGGKILAEGTVETLVERFAGNAVLEIESAPGGHEALLAEARGWPGAEVETMEEMVFVFGRNGELPAVETAAISVVRRPPTLEDVFLRLTGRRLID